jgi:transposase
MVRYRDILRLDSLGLDNTEIADACGCHRNTVTAVLRRAKEKGLVWPLPKEMGDVQIYRLLWPGKSRREVFAEPDWATVQLELAKKHVTLNLLWQEYRDECVAAGKTPYQRSTFGEHYAKWAETHSAIMHIERRPAEKLEVDWAGTVMQLYDKDTGSVSGICTFVACLPYSGLIYAEGFLSMSSEMWLTAHVHAFSAIGGVALSLVPDNLKVGVSSRGKDGVLINRAYQDLAAYYNTAVIPTRIRKPKDKSAVEAAVGLVSRRAFAAMRNTQFFSLKDFNDELKKHVDEINRAPFTNRPGSRREAFENMEKPSLMPLPPKPYEVASWGRATVQSNYHVQAGKSYYSVPFEYIRRKADVRITNTAVEIFIDGNRVATHPRSFERHVFVTNKLHMPQEHRQWASSDLDGLLKQADGLDPDVGRCARAVIAEKSNPQRATGTLRRLMNLARRFSERELIGACKWALEVAKPQVLDVQTIGYLIENIGFGEQEGADDFGALLRGEKYFGTTDEKEDDHDGNE